MRNSFENRVAAQLGPDFEYEAIRLPYTLQCNYVPDFIDADRKEIVEAKGLFDAADRRKLKAVKAQYPDWTIRVLFMNPNKPISKGSKTTYAAWCEKQGIAWEQGPMVRPRRKA